MVILSRCLLDRRAVSDTVIRLSVIDCVLIHRYIRHWLCSLSAPRTMPSSCGTARFIGENRKYENMDTQQRVSLIMWEYCIEHCCTHRTTRPNVCVCVHCILPHYAILCDDSPCVCARIWPFGSFDTVFSPRTVMSQQIISPNCIVSIERRLDGVFVCVQQQIDMPP